MSTREQPRILVLDLRRRRGEVLRAILAPLAPGRVRFADSLGDALLRDEVLPELVIVDPPLLGLDPALLRTLVTTTGGARVLVLTGPNQPGATPHSSVHHLDGPLLPSRLRGAVAALLAERSPAKPQDLLTMLEGLLPLVPETRRLLERAEPTRAPVLLTGEPGTGKSLVARALFARGATRFVRIELPRGGPLAVALEPVAGRPATVYLSLAEGLDPAAQVELLDWLETADDHGGRLVLGGAELEPSLANLRDDLRLRIEPLAVELPPLRQVRDMIPTLFARTVGALAVTHDLEAPSLALLEPTLKRHSWPLNFEELVSSATRCLFRASGREALPDDLGLGAVAQADATHAHHAAQGRDVLRPRSLDVLVQELAHEIKNPLVSIKTFTQLLPERFEDAEFREQYHRLVSEDVERIDAVLAEMAAFARLRDPVPVPADLAELVRKVLEGQRFVFKKRSIELGTSFPDGPCPLNTDPDLLAYALESSVRESLNALPDRGRLEVSVVNDQGQPEMRLRFQTAATGTRGLRGESIGRPREVLGLRHTLAAQVIASLGGRLEIEDTLDGETRIRVSFDDQA